MYDTRGGGILITNHSGLQFYLSLLNHQASGGVREVAVKQEEIEKKHETEAASSG